MNRFRFVTNTWCLSRSRKSGLREPETCRFHWKSSNVVSSHDRSIKMTSQKRYSPKEINKNAGANQKQRFNDKHNDVSNFKTSWRHDSIWICYVTLSSFNPVSRWSFNHCRRCNVWRFRQALSFCGRSEVYSSLRRTNCTPIFNHCLSIKLVLLRWNPQKLIQKMRIDKLLLFYMFINRWSVLKLSKLFKLSFW